MKQKGKFSMALSWISHLKSPKVDVSCPDCAFAGVVLFKGLAKGKRSSGSGAAW
jgi:hypothetical protein